ncbi:MAG: hypothetical protein J1G38_00815 [Clostridiales bacterium]|nr:hypothetical protein [Clostridiales bacterium]
MKDSVETGELGALDDILEGLGVSKVDGVELLQRFGSYDRVFDASVSEMEECDVKGRAAEFFTYGKKVVRQAALRELCDFFPSEFDAVRFAETYFVGKKSLCERLLILDGTGDVDNVVELSEKNPLRDVVGQATLSGARHVLWMSFVQNVNAMRFDRRRKREVEIAAHALKSIGITLVDYIEYRPPRFYSTVAAKRGSGYIDKQTANRDMYKAFAVKLNTNLLKRNDK